MIFVLPGIESFGPTSDNQIVVYQRLDELLDEWIHPQECEAEVHRDGGAVIVTLKHRPSLYELRFALHDREVMLGWGEHMHKYFYPGMPDDDQVDWIAASIDFIKSLVSGAVETRFQKVFGRIIRAEIFISDTDGRGKHYLTEYFGCLLLPLFWLPLVVSYEVERIPFGRENVS